jgi:molecular chaperone GrpE
MSTAENELKTGQSEEVQAAEHSNQTGPEAESAKLSLLEAKIKEMDEKYLRLYSEFDNYRRRTAKEKIENMLSAGEEIFKLILPLLDDFERAIKHNETTTEAGPVKEGFNLIYNKFMNSLQQKGLTVMEPLGKPFDADLHEAITNIPASSEDMKGKVMDVVEKGYALNGKVIRLAKVIVGK